MGRVHEPRRGRALRSREAARRTKRRAKAGLCRACRDRVQHATAMLLSLHETGGVDPDDAALVIEGEIDADVAELVRVVFAVRGAR